MMFRVIIYSDPDGEILEWHNCGLGTLYDLIPSLCVNGLKKQVIEIQRIEEETLELLDAVVGISADERQEE